MSNMCSLQVVKETDLPKNCFCGENFLQFHLRPIKQQGFDRSDIPQKIDVNSIVLETQTLLAGELNNVNRGTGFEERSHNRAELKSLGSVRSLSTSSSAGSRDLIRDPSTLSTFGNPVRDILKAVGVPFLSCEEGGEGGVSLREWMEMKARQSVFNHKNYEIVFLGTGASLPSKYRNVSSTLINMR